jgi:phosphomannomutase
MTAQLETKDAWKPCDLRGSYPDTVSPALFRDIGGAIGTLLAHGARVVVAGDYRLSTHELKSALTAGLWQAGANVLDAGHGPTPLAYFAAQHLAADAVLIVTASHNPAGQNGLKLMLGSAPTTPRQLAEIRALAEARSFRQAKGSVENVDPRAHYMKTIVERWRHLRGTGRRVILDAGNGAWSELAPVVFGNLGFETRCFSCVIDGSFPDRSPDCARAANLVRLSKAVQQQGDAIGIAWDGDGDRAAFVDEDGSYVTPDEIAILFARKSLAATGANSSGNRKMVIDVKCSDAVRREVVEGGGEPLIERTGHAFMRGRMVEEQALLGLDACGHYFFRELKGGDDGLFSALFLLEMVESSGSTLRALRRDLPKIFTTPELRIPATMLSFSQASRQLRAAFPEAGVTEIDGVRLLMGDGAVLVRESGTEPVLSLRIEGFDRRGYERILAHTLSTLPEAAELLRQELEETRVN